MANEEYGSWTCPKCEETVYELKKDLAKAISNHNRSNH